jgi:hypothetical protein
MKVLLVLVATASLLIATEQVQAQNNGDIRLVNNTKNNQVTIDIIGGRLEIFIDGKWGTICDNNSTDLQLQAVADTACRQLGKARVSMFEHYGTVTKLGFPVAPKSTPIHFGSIDCGSPSFNWIDVCSANYRQHVLRCAVDPKVDTTACTHDNDIGIVCSTIGITVDPYKSQISLYPTSGQKNSPNVSLSSGALRIFVEKSNINKTTLSLICGEGFDKSAADTACRQLGYTNANYFNSTTLQTTNPNLTFWDAGLNCKSQSHSCLNNCFSKTPTNYTSCKNWVYLSCEFDLSHKNAESAGTPHLCDTTVDGICKSYFEEHTDTVAIIVVVVVIVAILAACATCITLLVCCFVPGCLIHRKRSGYQSVN